MPTEGLYNLEGQTPKLVVFVNEFEDVEPLVMQDLFYICRFVLSLKNSTAGKNMICGNISLHIPRLPLVFVLALSSPNEPSFLHAVYPRATLALLQLKRIGSTGGADTLQSLLLKVRQYGTFFTLDSDRSEIHDRCFTKHRTNRRFSWARQR